MEKQHHAHVDMSDTDETVKNINFEKVTDFIGDSGVKMTIPKIPGGAAAPKLGIDKFDSSEHDMIGQQAFALFTTVGRFAPLLAELAKHGYLIDNEWYITNEFRLTTGKIIAMAGDYFGVAEAPICEGGEKHFKLAYNELLKAKVTKINRLKDVIDKEIDDYCTKLSHGQLPTVSYGEYGYIATFGRLPLTVLHSLYLASHNFDHFGADAVTAYKAGHRVALQTARLATIQTEDKERCRLIAEAFTQELFACHFLTDLFASGHVRTPRREIYNYVKSKIVEQLGEKAGDKLPGICLVAGFLAKSMHDEDNKAGLNVESLKSEEDSKKDTTSPTFWKTHGDACYVKIKQVDRTRIAEAVVAGLTDVVECYLGNLFDIEQGQSVKHIPKTPPKVEINPDSNPLFRVVSQNEVELRDDLEDPSCSTYTRNWHVTSTCSSLLVRNFIFTKSKKKASALSGAELEKFKDDCDKLRSEIEDLYGKTSAQDFIEVNEERKTCTIL